MVQVGIPIWTHYMDSTTYLYLCLSCARFCRGCLIECDDQPLSEAIRYIAIDWQDAFLYLKYQSAMERVITCATIYMYMYTTCVYM